MSDQVVKQETKQWKTAATFYTYKEADIERKKLLKTNELVKVRMGDRGKVFRVKVWNTPEKKKNPINKKTKKGKNENKKVRFRQTSK